MHPNCLRKLMHFYSYLLIRKFHFPLNQYITKKGGIAVGAYNFEENIYDGHTLPEVLEQVKRLTEQEPKVAIVDRGYRGVSKVGDTEILRPKRPKKKATPYEKTKARKRFRRRAAIEPVIGHLKQDFRLSRNFLKGTKGDMVNVLLATAAYNLTKWMRMESKKIFLFVLSRISKIFDLILIPKIKIASQMTF